MKKVLSLFIMLFAFVAISNAQCAAPTVIGKNKVGNFSYLISYRIVKPAVITGGPVRSVSYDNGATWQEPGSDPCIPCMTIYADTPNYYDFTLTFSNAIPFTTTQNSFLVRIRFKCTDGTWSNWSESVKVRIH